LLASKIMGPNGASIDLMPWAEQLPSGAWRGFWRDDAGRKRSRSGFSNAAKAKRYAGEQEARTRRGEVTGDGRAPTWGEWCPIWLDARTVEPSTLASDELRIARYLKPQWSSRRLNRIGRTEVQAWVNQLAKSHLSPASVEKVYRLFSASMTAAVLDEALPVGTRRAQVANCRTVSEHSGIDLFLTIEKAVVRDASGPWAPITHNQLSAGQPVPARGDVPECL